VVSLSQDLVVIHKPSGLLSVPARKSGGHVSAVGVVRRVLGSALPVHRLDEQTSGLMLVALNQKAQIHLKAQLEEHSVQRRYVAFVQGKPRREEWRCQSVFIRNRGDGLRGSRPIGSEESGKEAVTHFSVQQQIGFIAVVQARLETGRTHQVRIHLAEGRHPILGDPLYARGRPRHGASRLCLHAAELEFEHPTTKEQMSFNAPLADDMAQLRRALIREMQFVRSARSPIKKSRKGKKNKRKRASGRK